MADESPSLPQLTMSGQDVAPVRTRSLVIPAAITVGLLIMGDSFMYSALPLAGPAMGLSLLEISLLLSANRWIRLLSNSIMASLLLRLPMRFLFTGATGLGLLSTLAFVRPFGFPLYLVARLAWGLSWSVFRQSAYLAVWLQQVHTQGRSLGSWWGLVRLGSGLGVLVGGLILDRSGFGPAMLGLSGLAVIGILVSLILDWPDHNATPMGVPSVTRDVLFQTWARLGQQSDMIWSLALAIGTRLCLTLTIALISLFLQERLEFSFDFLGLGFIAGLVLAIHWVSAIVAAPLVGAASDRFGRTRTIILMTVLVSASLIAAAMTRGYTALASAVGVMLFFSGLRVAVEVGVSSLAQRDPHPHLVMGIYSTLDDFAAALGPIIGLAWYQPVLLQPLLGGCAAVILFLALGYVRSRQTQSSRVLDETA